MQVRPAVHPRVHEPERALQRHGQRALRCFAALERCDRPADDLVEWLAGQPERFDLAAAWDRWQSGDTLAEPLAQFFESVRPIPAWVDWRRIDRARRLFERTGPFGGIVLSLRSLMAGYTSPAGNKPLAFSGRLREQAPRRVAETARFVTAVCAPGGMRPGAEGWLITLHVRLMHAQVRRLLWRSGRWDRARWAEPINQHDMLATMLLFSEVYVEGLRIFGFSIDVEEAEDWIHLWRLVAWVMGTEQQLLPIDYVEAAALRDLIYETQGPPDADSRALAAALLEMPAQVEGLDPRLESLRRSMIRGMSRMLLGDEPADQLGIARAPGWARALSFVPPLVNVSERARKRVPVIERELRSAGADYWAWVVDMSLRGEPARFARPERLGAR
ncbi:MAG TPA: oxygenase MpaB family protein [Enhygromyxa sp.]|nr:oxygenase MpaB family protein [Enhygromyxa sp.]